MKYSRLLISLSFLLSSCVDGEVLSFDSDSRESITIAYAEPLSTFSPLSYEAKNRKYLANIYEPLVSFDSSFNMETALAVSWGRLDDSTWDFRLREDVFFHDGSAFDADDVVYSLRLAQDQEGSELGALLGTIEGVEKTGTHRLSIKTDGPDPLLLNKLTYLYIIPDGYEDFNVPVGTGPYRISSYSDNILELERFEAYWGALAYFKEAKLQYISDPDERKEAFLSGEVQVLANVPPQAVADLEAATIEVEDFPSLEVSFLMFNTKSVFSDENLRAAVWNALGTDFAETLGGGYLMETSQVAASGITGYMATWENRVQDLDAAKQARALYEGEVVVTLDLPSGLAALGEAIAEDLEQIDISVSVNSLSPDLFEDKILSGASDFYFFGWKYDLADSADFFESVIHSKEEGYGEFNGIAYSNLSLDEQIEEASSLLDYTQRRTLLETLTEQLMEDQVVLPLFESRVLYALGSGLYYNFRLDGLIMASEIVENMVK